MRSGVRAPQSQKDMNMSLISAAGALDERVVVALLAAGAEASFLRSPPGTWGAQDQKSALHAALESEGDARWRVVDKLITARADVNAERVNMDWRGCGSSKTAFEIALRDVLQDRSRPVVYAIFGLRAKKQGRRF